jgi:hypothetical protein
VTTRAVDLPIGYRAAPAPRVTGRPLDWKRPYGGVVYQKGRSSEPSVVSPALWLPEFDSQ